MVLYNIQGGLVCLSSIRGQNHVRLFQNLGRLQGQQLRVSRTHAHTPELAHGAKAFHCRGTVLGKQLPDGGALPQALQDAPDGVARIFQLPLPGVVVPCHIVPGMVSGHQHKGGQGQLFDFRMPGKLVFNPVQGGIALHRAHENPGAPVLEILLQLAIGGIGKMRGAVAHEDQGLVCLGRGQPAQQGIRHGLVVLLFIQQRLAHGDM